MKSIGWRIAAFSLAAILMTGVCLTTTSGTALGFDDEYVYAATRAVNDMDANPALKVTLFPATIILDTAFLPFAVIAGFIT